MYCPSTFFVKLNFQKIFFLIPVVSYLLKNTVLDSNNQTKLHAQ